MPVANDWLPNDGQQAIVKQAEPGIDGFLRSAAEMGGDSFFRPSNLPRWKNRKPEEEAGATHHP
jgi:hypothetical protein